MGIVTKKGDDGTTSLLWGGRVRKDDIRISLCGDLDELSSYLGMSKFLTKDKFAKRTLESVQRDISILCAEVATKIPFTGRLKERLGPSHIKMLEDAIERIEPKRRSRLRCFVVPGRSFISSTMDITRAVARRAERSAVALYRKGFFKNKHAVVYLNRLSDLLYLLSREHE
jgi:cob(I)alamin adenosyltransferase